MNTTAAGYANTRLLFYVRTAENGGVGAFCLIAGPCRGRNASGVAEAEKWDDLYTFVSGLDKCLADIPRVRLYSCLALLHTGRIDEAYDLLYADGGLSVPDIREGEVSITNLWLDITEAKAKKDGESFERDKAVPPKKFDFRMNAM